MKSPPDGQLPFLPPDRLMWHSWKCGIRAPDEKNKNRKQNKSGVRSSRRGREWVALTTPSIEHRVSESRGRTCTSGAVQSTSPRIPSACDSLPNLPPGMPARGSNPTSIRDPSTAKNTIPTNASEGQRNREGDLWRLPGLMTSRGV